jgi:hypothetical protein
MSAALVTTPISILNGTGSRLFCSALFLLYLMKFETISVEAISSVRSNKKMIPKPVGDDFANDFLQMARYLERPTHILFLLSLSLSLFLSFFPFFSFFFLVWSYGYSIWCLTVCQYGCRPDGLACLAFVSCASDFLGDAFLPYSSHVPPPCCQYWPQEPMRITHSKNTKLDQYSTRVGLNSTSIKLE